jgi:predicted DNA-binding protein with PD1-like motif
MKVIESHRTRHVVLRIERGEELPFALTRALDDAGVKSGWIEGFGTLEAADVAVFDARMRSYGKARRLEPGGDCVSLRGNVSQLEGSACVRLFATVARETETGLQAVGGELLWARAFAVELHITAFEDAGLSRVADDRTGMLTLVRGSSAGGGGDGRIRVVDEPGAASPSSPRHAPGLSAAPAARGSSPRAADTMPSIVDMARAALGSGAEQPQPLMPPRRERPREDLAETYPEVGDIATHFHFGECKIISSDGDKIRLQQLKDLRVREVALSALRTELESEDPETRQRHFRLLRKN